jgi:multidrug efflux pump subunit AcrB
MSVLKDITQKFKEFKPTSWAVDNRTAMYIITIIITLMGLRTFNTLPKEQFPDIVVPTISVSTVYFGTSPKDMENLVTRPIEKQIKGLTGAKIKKVNSISQQDFSLITVEFETDVNVDIAKDKVKNAVDRAKTDLPTDLTVQPNVQEFTFSELPIMFVNVSGDYDAVKLKEYADKLQDRFEELPMISKAEIVGAPEREIQINVDKSKMEVSKVSFNDIAQAIANENRDVSGGLVEVGNMNRSLRVKGQFVSAMEMQNIIVKNIYGQAIYLKDIAQVIDTVKEKESYSRLDRKNVVTVNIVKRAGENLIETADKVKEIVAEMYKAKELPQNLKVSFTGDQSKQTKTSFNELVNTIIIGFVLVLVILMFFMGVTNAFFVALSVPLSVFVAFLFLPLGDYIVGTSITLNFIVLFALLFGLGIIVDDAIVVIENTHRIYANGRVPVVRAAKEAAGEVFIPVLAGTVTTLAPFFPLLLWEGIIGKFMIYLPTMLILTLSASLIVAFIFNPVFAVSTMQPEGHEFDEPKNAIFKKWYWWLFIAMGLLLHLAGWHGFANFLLLLAILAVLNNYVLKATIYKFQHNFLPRLMDRYEKLLRWALQGTRPAWSIAFLFLLFPVSLMLVVLRGPDIQFFPSGDPNIIYAYLKMPVGTKTAYTDSVTAVLEKRVFDVLGENNPIVESVISNVAVGATDPNDPNKSTQSNLGRIQISFVEFEKRHGQKTMPYLDSIRAAVKGIPGALITVDQEQGGPPTQPPVNIEVIGEDFEAIAGTATSLKNYLDTVRVEGIENLKLDIDLSNPEISVNVDREKALLVGLSTGQIGFELRTAIFGREASKLKIDEDEYKIQIRYNDLQRNNITDLMNMKITYRDFTTGQIKQVPLGAVATVDYTNTAGGIRRKNYKRVITLYSNVTGGYTPFDVNERLKPVLNEFNDKYKPAGVSIKQTGEGEEQAETISFLGWAMAIALGLIFMTLVLQFNSLSKPFIVLNEIFFSIIGVLLGIAITKMNVPTIMVGVGVVGLAGIVVKNAILLIEFTDELRGRGMRMREAAIQAGRIRIIPVLLTALATMLGLIPLAVGFNIDFVSLFQHLNPHIFFGGDSVVFWGPLSWTIIYGLILAFFLTLTMVPSMYIIAERLKRPMERFYGTKFIALLGFLGPFFFIFVGIMFLVRRIQGKKVWMGQLKPAPSK